MNIANRIGPGQRAVVMGLGVSGRAALRYLLASGVQVFVSDSRQFTELPVSDREYLLENRVAFEGGGHSREFLLKGDFIVLSPGIPTDLPLLMEMRAQDIPILGELALAAPQITEQVVAVTGTNGKTTVTALIGELLQASGKKVFVGGNIGTPLLDYLCQDERVDVLVLELSSFQLESAGDFRPDIGILLNITPDHLNRHGSMLAYAAAKMKLFAHQGAEDKAILCSDDPLCREHIPLLTRQKVFSFGTGQEGEARGAGSELTITLEGRTESYSLAGTQLASHTGLLNSGAAVLAALFLGCRHEEIQQTLNCFAPAAHRLQLVSSRAGVDYYDDSKATNTGAVLSALASFPGKVILIAGGRGKGEDYRVLREAVREKVKGLVLMGEAADSLADALDDVILSQRAVSMADAVARATQLAEAGDVVLLSPACASFDMFNSYGHRGEVFSQAVLDLQGQRGEERA
ncbi:MAG: UDP-N-acetylmuramoyl-L-alanine--D-glutamate ligase [Proteobacteria bacterium]|nr:UDP-N-acetylmuramoyl-L-alanine--D-glutamate ligase [Pseudomonadota bacterium]MBU1060304.1 UDP-N-acetylmuramoyl-L-alanine--D-glutamate ligase [Pseudomonadota bacterium]